MIRCILFHLGLRRIFIFRDILCRFYMLILCVGIVGARLGLYWCIFGGRGRCSWCLGFRILIVKLRGGRNCRNMGRNSSRYRNFSELLASNLVGSKAYQYLMKFHLNNRSIRIPQNQQDHNDVQALEEIKCF